MALIPSQKFELDDLSSISPINDTCLSDSNNSNNGHQTAKEEMELQNAKIEDSQVEQVLANYRDLIEESQLSAVQFGLLLEVIYIRLRTSFLENSPNNNNNTDNRKSKQIPKSPIQLWFPETETPESIRSASDSSNTSCFLLKSMPIFPESPQLEDFSTSDSALNTAFLSDRRSSSNSSSYNFNFSKDFSTIESATGIHSSPDVISNSISSSRSSGSSRTTKSIDTYEVEVLRISPPSSSDETWTTCKMSTISCSTLESETTESFLSSSLNSNTATLTKNEKLKEIIRKYLGCPISDIVTLEH